MSVLIIIPAYNEEETILNAVNKIKKYNEEHDEKYDYVVINDGSTDKTETILRENNLNHVELVHNLGIGGAVQAGYIYAYQNNYDVAVQYDGDGQHDIAYVSKIVEPIIKEGYNMVIGSRFVDGHKSQFQTTGARRMGIKLISTVIKFKSKEFPDNKLKFLLDEFRKKLIGFAVQCAEFDANIKNILADIDVGNLYKMSEKFKTLPITNLICLEPDLYGQDDFLSLIYGLGLINYDF